MTHEGTRKGTTTVRWKMLLLIFLGLTALLAAALVHGGRRWQTATERMLTELNTGRRPVEPKTYNPEALAGLPGPVQRYFRGVMDAGQRMIAAVSLEQAGTFNRGESEDQWRPFTADQLVVTRRPGFVWHARIAMLPGISALVHDAYVSGEGILHASLFGLVTVAEIRGTGDAAEGEFMRFAAEAPWYPTALLPSQGVQWEPVDDTSAKATLRDGAVAVTLLFRFDKDGLIESVRAEARGRLVGGEFIPTPWEGRFSDYERRDGILIPLEAEVSWILPGGPKPYWRGRVTRLTYELAR